MEELTEMPESEEVVDDSSVDTSIVDDVEETEDVETVDGDDEEGEAEEGSSSKEFEEVEFDGKKYAIPPELKDKFLMQSDYTRKTQELATQRQAVEAQAAQIQQQAAAQQQYLQEYAEVIALDNQIKQYKNVDWETLITEDPVQAQRLKHQMGELQAQRDQLSQSVMQRQQQHALETQQETAKRLQEANEAVKRDVPNWGPELHSKLITYGKTLGFTDQEIANAVDPRSWVILDKAAKYDAMVAKQATKPKKEPQGKPVTRIAASKQTRPKSLADKNLSDKEWNELRRKQIAARG